MQLDWFSPKKLAARLANDQVSNREIAYLILAGLVWTTVVYYGAFTWANDAFTWLTLYEFIVCVAVIVYGMTKCFAASGGDSNRNFAADFNCLSFPVWFWTLTIVWGIYWAAKLGFKYGMITNYSYEKMGFYQVLFAIGANVDWLWTFMANIGAQIMFFVWMHSCLRRMALIRDRVAHRLG
jgi:hypothetical protein